MPDCPTLRRILRSFALLATFAFGPSWAQSVTFNGEDCGPLSMAGKHGPFDYRKSSNDARDLVERFHFTPKTEMLIEPAVIKPDGFAADYGYTLFAFPNHPRALMAMGRLALRDKTTKPKYATWSVDCYFARAMAFTPDDHMVPLLYADYLRQAGRRSEAVSHLKLAAIKAPHNPLTHNNIALQFISMGDTETAGDYARKARELGLDQPSALEELKRLGK